MYFLERISSEAAVHKADDKLSGGINSEDGPHYLVIRRSLDKRAHFSKAVKAVDVFPLDPVLAGNLSVSFKFVAVLADAHENLLKLGSHIVGLAGKQGKGYRVWQVLTEVSLVDVEADSDDHACHSVILNESGYECAADLVVADVDVVWPLDLGGNSLGGKVVAEA